MFGKQAGDNRYGSANQETDRGFVPPGSSKGGKVQRHSHLHSPQKQQPDARGKDQPNGKHRSSYGSRRQFKPHHQVSATACVQKKAESANDHGARLQRGIRFAIRVNCQPQSGQCDRRGGPEQSRKAFRFKKIRQKSEKGNHDSANCKSKQQLKHLSVSKEPTSNVSRYSRSVHTVQN